MIVYGKNVWDALQKQKESIEIIYIQKGLKDKNIVTMVQKGNVPYQILTRSEMDALVQNRHHQGIACKVKPIQTYSIDELIKPNGLLVALDGIQDPQNVGAILRTCDCCGVQGLIITKHKSAHLTPAAIKASTGAAYSVPCSIVNNLSQTLKQLKKSGYWIIGSDMQNARDYRQGIYDVPMVLVIGSEGKGISPLVKKQCDYMVKLPMQGNISSLNASAACAVLLYQIYNQRNPL